MSSPAGLRRRLLQPFLEVLRSEARAGTCDEALVVELSAEVGGVRIRDHLALIAARAQHAFHQLRHREFLRSADLDDAVDRWPECDVGEHGNDVAGQDRLEQRRRDMNALLTGSRDTTDELEELRRA